MSEIVLSFVLLVFCSFFDNDLFMLFLFFMFYLPFLFFMNFSSESYYYWFLFLKLLLFLKSIDFNFKLDFSSIFEICFNFSSFESWTGDFLVYFLFIL
jgi:hypothetical protein